MKYNRHFAKDFNVKGEFNIQLFLKADDANETFFLQSLLLIVNNDLFFNPDDYAFDYDIDKPWVLFYLDSNTTMQNRMSKPTE